MPECGEPHPRTSDIFRGRPRTFVSEATCPLALPADLVDVTRLTRPHPCPARAQTGWLLDTLPERLVLRQRQMPHQDFLLLVRHDEVARRDSAAVTLRAAQAQVDRSIPP
jgi:hypothetical protein